MKFQIISSLLLIIAITFVALPSPTEAQLSFESAKHSMERIFGPVGRKTVEKVEEAFSNCCYFKLMRNCTGTGEVKRACGDCSSPTPYCSEQPCNTFGCNCVSCRQNTNPYVQELGSSSWV